jgi:GT2 family glycosyltransferase
MKSADRKGKEFTAKRWANLAASVLVSGSGFHLPPKSIKLGTMEISVVIPVRNRPDEIGRAVRGALASRRAAGLGDDACEVIVVDNGSTDATARLAEEAGARVVKEPMPSRSRARNLGAREARGRWVAFLDSDCEPDEAWLGNLTKRIRDVEAAKAVGGTGQDRGVGAVAGAVRDAEPATAVMAYLSARRWFDQEKYLARSGKEPFVPRFALTANLAARRDVFLELGGLDPALAHAAEDADFCLRLADAGWGLEYCAEAAVTHHHRATARGLWRQAVGWGAGQTELFVKWQGRWGRRAWVEPCHYAWALKGLLKAPWRLATGRTPLERWEPWYDFLANAGLAWGRASMGLRKGKLVL